jgi:HD-GYP domain-containing protein (c-di-GMP phosphodiesterase class II)
LEIVKIYATDLEPGMYISSLDRPWLDTPFTLQGFRLQSEEDIRRLQKSKSVQDATIVRRKMRNRPRLSNQELFANRTLKRYTEACSWEEEYPRALKAVMTLSKGIEVIYSKMSDSACIWLARLKQEDRYTYQHPLGASIWAVALGRQLGLPKTDLRTLAIGSLLFDVGKLGVDPELLSTTRQLSDEEFEQVRNHVKLGVEMIQGSALMNTDVIDMITYHHERHDGSGYPKGLRGDDIPVFARIAAIVDCFDAITSHRGYARAISPSSAIKMLYEWKDIDFQGELVEEFIQAVGIYPAGTLVELSNGEIGVVMAAYREHRLRPRVMVLLDADKQELAIPRTLDLANETNADGSPLEIKASLDPNAHGIDLSKIPI